MSFQAPSGTSSDVVDGTGGRPLSVEDFVVLNDEIRALVRAGIPLELGLRGVGGRARGALRQVSESLAHRLEMGASLDEALSDQEQLPKAYRAIVSAGLRTGRLDEVLQSLTELAASTAALRRQLRVSLIYPAIILMLAYGLFVAFVIYLVPQIERTYDIFGIEPSYWATRLLSLHRHVAVWGIAAPAVALGLLLLWALVRRLRGGAEAGLLLHRWLPGGRDLAVARFARLLCLLTAHNVPFPEGCRIAGDAAGERRIRLEADRIATAIEGGRPLPEAIATAHRLPAFLRWLMAVGDRQGRLPLLLRQAAELYELRALTKLAWLRRILPPLIVLGCCGGITLLYGLTLFVPMTELIRRMGLP